ncbi:MAG TPA: MaoC/PaaZ C-terminal domain-containing protein [Acidimicrobiia bacterium]|nr:MaoC/PaaZ C-terminal domain-containing protein [Acidimicrobiia bacterium]
MDPSTLVDQRFGPRPFRVCVENVGDFVTVTGDDPERWIGAAPPGFVAAALFVVAPDLLGQFTDRSVIHGEQTFTWHRPLTMETDLEVSGTVSRVRERGGVNFVNFDLEVEGPDGGVADGSAMFLVSGDSTEVSGTEEAVEAAPHEDGNPGPGEVSASRADLVRYAAATRDWNPIHWDHEAAVAAGVPGVVVHGLLQASWAFAAASRLRSGDRPLLSAKVRFRNPLLPATPANLKLDTSDDSATVTIGEPGLEYISARIVLSDE